MCHTYENNHGVMKVYCRSKYYIIDISIHYIYDKKKNKFDIIITTVV